MNVHIKAEHKKLKPSVCSICGKSFTSRQNMQSHKRIHDRTRSSACPICDKWFTLKWNMKQHIQKKIAKLPQ